MSKLIAMGFGVNGALIVTLVRAAEAVLDATKAHQLREGGHAVALTVPQILATVILLFS